MSAAAAEPIRTPEQLDLPEGFRTLADGLPAGSRARLADELLAALEAARASGDLTPIQATVRRWEDFAARVEAARRELAQWMAEHQPGADPLLAALRAGATPASLGLVDAQTSLERIAAARGIDLQA